jgi:hypothetical protein
LGIGYITMKIHLTLLYCALKMVKMVLRLVTHACNLSYLGGGDLEDRDFISTSSHL